MASNSRVSILDYFNIVFEGENGKIESNCKACGTRIQAKRTVTSNFVTHLKVSDIKYMDFVELIKLENRIGPYLNINLHFHAYYNNTYLKILFRFGCRMCISNFSVNQAPWTVFVWSGKIYRCEGNLMLSI